MAAHSMAAHSGRIYAIQYVRGIAALLIVIYHAASIIGLPQYQNNRSFLDAVVGIDRGVDLFFVLSGFVLSLALFSDRVRAPGKFLLHRILRIWPLGLLTTVIYFVSQGAVGTYDFVDDFGRFVKSSFLIPHERPSIPVVLWSLKQELIFYVVFTSVWVNRRVGLGLVAVWAIASVLISGESALMRAVFHAQNIQFLMGVVACWLCHRVTLPGRIANVLFPLSGLLFLWVVTAPDHQSNQDASAAIIIGLVSAVVIVCGYFVSLPPIEPLRKLGDITFSLYLIHYLALSLGNRILLRSPIDLPDGLVLVLLVIGGVVSGVLFYPVEAKLEKMRTAWEKRDPTLDLRSGVRARNRSKLS